MVQKIMQRQFKYLHWTRKRHFPYLILSHVLCDDAVEIIGGKDVRPHSKPYMASIQLHQRHECGGILIKRGWVLTATHCNLSILINLALRPGNAAKFFPPHLHSSYIFPRAVGISTSPPRTYMTVQLQTEAKLNKFVNVLPLPKNAWDVNDGTICTVVGWGKTNVKSNKLSDNLKEVNVTTINRAKCNSKNYYNNNPVITTDMLCAGDSKGGKDACQGDSGGPLICKNELRGIVSLEKNCGLRDKPGIYTRITNEYIKWIRKITD
ncbi:granzyme K-like [Mustelus asterias]